MSPFLTEKDHEFAQIERRRPAIRDMNDTVTLPASLGNPPMATQIATKIQSSMMPVSIWSQAAQRSYIPQAYCFAYDDETPQQQTIDCLRAVVQRLGKLRPDFAARLWVNNDGWLYLCSSPTDAIPFNVLDLQGTFPYSLDQLQADGFPASAFVNPAFVKNGDLRPGGSPVPVTQVQISFFEGGLILWVYVHHSFADGKGYSMFVDCLASLTRGQMAPQPSSPQLVLPMNYKPLPNQLTRQRLVQGCPEFCILSRPIGPTQAALEPGLPKIEDIQRTGKIFVFRNDRIAQLKAYLAAGCNTPQIFTTYTCLAALTWAHVTKARFATASKNAPSNGDGHDALPDARLITPISWRSRCFREQMANYFGNATASLLTTIPTAKLIAACDDPALLRDIVRVVRSSINGVNEDWVLRRTALFQSFSDPRYIGLSSDPRRPTDLGFNTWRFIGADAKWNIPGVASPTPAAVRKVQAAWNLAGSVFMPAAAGSELHELLLTLSVEDMSLLCADEEWLRWVDRVVE